MAESAEMINPEPGWRGWNLAGASLAILVTLEFVERVVIRDQALVLSWAQATRGFVTPDLVANVLRSILIVFLVLGVGRFRLWDVGLGAGRILPGIGITAAIWGLTQIAIAIGSLTRAGGLALHHGWFSDPVASVSGFLPTLAEAVFQESFWRGYLMVWLVLELQSRFVDRLVATVVGVVASQVAFGLMHIPTRLEVGIPWGQLPIDVLLLTLTGIFYSLLYIRTENLFVPIGVHALSNWPMPLLEPQDDPAKMTILIASVFLFAPMRRAESREPEEPRSRSAEEGISSASNAISDVATETGDESRPTE